MNHLLLLVVLPLLSLGTLANTTLSDVSRSVTLRYFRAALKEDGVLLEWATASEVSTVGFRIERSTASSGPFDRLEAIGFVAARGDSLGGGEYSAFDGAVESSGQTLWYRIVEVESDGTEVRSAPVSVTLLGTSGTTNGASQEPTDATSSPTANLTETPPATLRPVTATLAPIPTATDFRSESGPESSVATVGAQSGYPPPNSSGNVLAAGIADNLAQVQSPTPADGYPIPPVGTPLPTSDADLDTGAYPGINPQPPITQPGGEEPATGFSTVMPSDQPSLTQPPAIGSDQSGTAAASTGEADQSQSVGTTVFLWLGFLVSLVIFAAGVYGSVLLFTRHRTRGG